MQYLFGQRIGIDKFCNNIFIPESFDTNISNQLLDYTITFVNSKHYNTYQNPVLNGRFKDLGKQK